MRSECYAGATTCNDLPAAGDLRGGGGVLLAPADPGQNPDGSLGGFSRDPKAYISQKYTLVVHLY